MPTGASPPMVCISNRSSCNRTCSIAPGAARIPNLMCAPSKAGPEAHETLVSLPLMVEANLGVGADIDCQRGFLGFRDAGGKQHGDMIRADIAGNVGQQMHIRAGGNLQADLARFDVHGASHGGHIGRQAKLFHRQPQEQMMDGRIADHHGFDNICWVVLRFLRTSRRRVGSERSVSKVCNLAAFCGDLLAAAIRVTTSSP